MNAPIQALYSTGQTLYAVLVSPVDGAVWNQVDEEWQEYSAGAWAQYAVPLTEYAGSGYYRAAYPIADPSFLSTDLVFLQGGGSPALGDSPIAPVSQSQGANVASVAGEVASARSLGASLSSQRVGAVVGTPTALTLVSDLSDATDDAFIGRILIMTSGDAAAQVQYISAYDGATKAVTLAGPLVTVPSDGDEFVIN